MQQNQLASVNYNRLAQLKKYTGADNNLWLVYDALVFSWQNSKIVQKGKKLCCPTINRIAELANVSERTAYRKIKKLEIMGLITSFTKRLKNGTVRSFFSICIDKIEQVVNRSKKEPKMAMQPNEYAETAKMAEPELPNCQFHIYKEKTVKEKNNSNNNTSTPENNKHIDQQSAVNVNFVADAQVDVALPNSQVAKTASPEEKIGDTLTKRQHCRINGAINNLIRKEGVRISDPKGLKAQVVFKILLKSDKSGGSNFQYQLNAAMKLIRESKWSTPHGYYKHSDEGRVIKSQILKRENQWKKQKRIEIGCSDVRTEHNINSMSAMKINRNDHSHNNFTVNQAKAVGTQKDNGTLPVRSVNTAEKTTYNFSNPFKEGSDSPVFTQLKTLKEKLSNLRLCRCENYR